MRKIKYIVFGILILFFLLWSRCVNAKFITQTQIIMSTEVTIIAEASFEDIQKAFDVIKKVDSLMNDYNPQSEISVLNREGKKEVSPMLREVILKSIHFSRITEGAFDITVGPLVRLWQRMGYERRLPTPRELKDTLSLVDYQKIRINGKMIFLEKKGMRLDVGGIAKGYAVDKAVEVLKKMGVKNALVNAGGDMYCLGEGPHGKWRVGIQHPRKMNEIVGIIEVKDKGIATSGDYRRYYMIRGKRYSHIINPATGWTVQDIPMSVTIIAPDATTADALATGVFVLGPKRGIELINNLPGVEGMIVSEGMQIVKSRDWHKFEH